MTLSKCLILATAFIVATAAKSPDVSMSISGLKYLGKYNVTHKKQFAGTTIGGLSGIDYDAKNDLYYVISDDRSAINPVRFYTVKLSISGKGIDSLKFTGVHSILQPNGKVYPAFAVDPTHTPDPEAIRFNAATGNLTWSSEGERILEEKQKVLVNPSINTIDLQGTYLDSIAPAANTRIEANEKGTRRNGGFESLTFSPDFKSVFYAVELPLYEDGVEPTTSVTNSWVRFYQNDLASHKNVAQYAYRLEPVAYPADPAGGFIINGLADILSLGDGKFLAVERSFSNGRLACTMKVFLADVSQAENIISNTSLSKTPTTRPVSKKLLLNMDDLGVYTDNLEGVTIGPDLPNGHHTLVFVSDDNFNFLQKTQFLLFEVIP